MAPKTKVIGPLLTFEAIAPARPPTVEALLTERFNEGIKITQLAKLHSRTYGAIKTRLTKLELLQK